jgi:hypothetical protein
VRSLACFVDSPLCLRLLSSGYEGPFVMYRVDGSAYRQRQEHAALPLQRSASSAPSRQLHSAPALSTVSSPPPLPIPTFQAPQSALGSDVMLSPLVGEHIKPRYRSQPWHASYGHAASMPLGSPYRRAPSPSTLRHPAQEQFGDRAVPSAHPMVLPPIIDPSGADDRHDGISYDCRPSPIQDLTAVSDIWTRSLASGGMKRSADEMQERRKSEGEESLSLRRQWENEERRLP